MLSASRDCHRDKINEADMLSVSHDKRFGSKKGMMQYTNKEFINVVRSFVLPKHLDVKG